MYCCAVSVHLSRLIYGELIDKNKIINREYLPQNFQVLGLIKYLAIGVQCAKTQLFLVKYLILSNEEDLPHQNLLPNIGLGFVGIRELRYLREFDLITVLVNSRAGI